MFDFIADRGVFDRVVRQVGLPQEDVRREAASRVVIDGAGQREALFRTAALGFLVAGVDGDVGPVGGTPCQRRRQIEPVVGRMVDLGATVARHAGDAVKPLALLIHRTCKVERGLAAVEIPALQFDFMQRRFGRALRRHVDQPARGDLPVSISMSYW
ncbi:hypothetical protein G6F68_017160 [Rhizopus microsporus]|nr:hypothetical protein G6F68_017160 [Rhizopus microsporus]